jgi:hypothetical protein
MFGEYYNFYWKIINMKWKWNEWLIFFIIMQFKKTFENYFYLNVYFKSNICYPKKVDLYLNWTKSKEILMEV